MTRRLEKVASLMQQQAAMVMTKEFSAANMAITVTKVDVSPDLKNARVYISLVGKNVDQVRPRIEKAAPGLIASYMSAKTDLRTIPHIRIVFDESGAYAEQISKLINTLKED